MTFATKSPEEKPYNQCIDCSYIGKHCDGPNFLAMSTERWCEWCHLRKEYLGWTNSKIADISGISKISVDRIMSGNVKDLRNTTMQAVTKALVNGSWGQYPCAMAELSEKEQNPAIVEQCKQLQAAMDKMTAEHKAEVDTVRAAYHRQIEFTREQMAAKDQLLKERLGFIRRKDRIITILSFALTITVLVIIAALIIDSLNPNIGFFWLDP